MQVSGALLGVQAGEMRLDDRSVGVRVRAPDSVRFDPRQLGALPVLLAADRDPPRRSRRSRRFESDGDARRAAARESAADDRR